MIGEGRRNMARTKYTREEKRARRKMKKEDRKRFRNEIKAQRRMGLGAVTVAIGLIALFGSRKKK